MPDSIQIYGLKECQHCLRAQETAEYLLAVSVPIQPVASMPTGSRLPGQFTIPVVVVDGGPVGGADELDDIAASLEATVKKSPGKGITGGKVKEMDSHDMYGQAGGAKSKSKSKSSKTSKSPTKRKLSAYAKFVKKFAADHKGQFKGPALMKNAGVAWGKMSDSEKAKFK